MSKKKWMKSRKKLLAAFIALIIIVLLFSVLWVVVLYLWWGQTQQYPSTDYDVSFGTEEGWTITIPAEDIQTWTATVNVDEDWTAVVENIEAIAEDTLEDSAE